MENNFDIILKNPNFIGSLIKLELIYINGDSKNDTKECTIDEGIVKNIYFDEINIISLIDCKINNINYIGIQMFQIVKIISLTILQQGTGEIDDHNFFKLSKPMGNNFKFRSNNQYLNSLLPIQIFKLIKQKQIKIPSLIKCKNSVKIFSPKQTLKSSEIKNENKIIYNNIWKNKTPPKLIYYPSDWFFIKNEKSDEKLIKFAFKEIEKQKKIGVSLRGKNISRWGEISLITFSTKKYVFTFDIIELKTNFILKFKIILESTSIKKIFYDSRCPADYFYNCLKIKIDNVFDIQAMNTFFLIYNYTNGLLPMFTYSLPNLIKMYLGVDSEFLFFEYRRIDYINEDNSIWLERPLSPDIEFGILCDVVYLLDLQKIIKKAILNSVMVLNNIFLNSIRFKSFENYYNILDEMITIPNEATKIISNSKNENELKKIGFVNDIFIYQNINQIDPNLVFSKDIIHQNIQL